jgi:hypothetical protein
MWWDVRAVTRLLLKERADREGCVPFIATVGGFVALGARAGSRPARAGRGFSGGGRRP